MVYKLVKCRDKLIELNRPFIMGIVNLSPESFHTNQHCLEKEQLLSKIEEIIHAGADIIDIGAVSTKPGLNKISLQEEKKRLIPMLKAVRRRFKNILISVDSTNDEILCEAIDLGIDIVNDVSGGQLKEETFKKIASNSIPYILTYNANGKMNNLIDQQNSSINEEALYFLSKKIHQIQNYGCKDIIIDLGFGFNKALEDNYLLFSRIQDFQIHNKPILIGISRKSMLFKLLETVPEKSLNATTTLHAVSLLKGASILRVHDVREANEVRKLLALIGQNEVN